MLNLVRYKDFLQWDVKRYTTVLFKSKYPIVELRKHIQEENHKVKPFNFPEDDFKILGVSNKVGLFDNEILKGSQINQAYKKVENGYLAYNPYRINVGSIGLKTDEQTYEYISPAYVVFSCKEDLMPEYLFLLFKTKTFNGVVRETTRGSVRQILAYDLLETMKIPLPPLDVQRQIVESYHNKSNLSNNQQQQVLDLKQNIEEYLYEELEIEQKVSEVLSDEGILKFSSFKSIKSWSFRDVFDKSKPISKIYESICLNDDLSLYHDIYRGKSPKYKDETGKYILNQKCNRWNDIDLTWGKEVSEEWYLKIEKHFFTKEGDIIINSTGDGTIGRATFISKKFEGLIYDSHILLLRINQNKINPVYLTYFLNSKLGQNQIENIKSAMATKQTELGITNLKNIYLVLPDIDVQNNIANHIDGIEKQIEVLNQQAEENKYSALKELEEEVFEA